MEKPDVERLKTKCSPDLALESIVKRRRIFRVVSLSLLLFGSTAAVASLVPLAAVLVIVGILFASKKIWSKGASVAKPFYDRYADAATAYKQAEDAFGQTAVVPASFNAGKQNLGVQRKQYEGLGADKTARMKVLDASRERKQRQHFLERFRIEDERIANIGPKNKVILAAWGIEDAWDVDEQKIEQIKGFGPVKRQALVDWP